MRILISLCLLSTSLALGTTINISAQSPACDGVTDDAAKVQTAIDSLATGDTLLISCKLGIGATGIHMTSKTNITVKGTAAHNGFRAIATTSQGTADFGPAMVLGSSCNGCVLSDLDLDENSLAGTAFDVQNSTGFKLLRNFIHDCGYASGGCVGAEGNTSNVYDSNWVYNTGSKFDISDATRGMWLGNVLDTTMETTATVTNNHVSNTGWTGIVLYSQGNSLVAGNVSDHAFDGAGMKMLGCYLDTAHSNALTYMTGTRTISGNIMQNVRGGVGLQIECMANAVITGNTMRFNERAGMQIGADGTGGTAGNFGISNSTISYNDIYDNCTTCAANGWASGILIFQAQTLTIDHNNLYDDRAAGSNTQDHGIQFNQVTSTAGGQNTTSGVTISNNFINNNSVDGIAIQNFGAGQAIANLAFNGNTISNNQGFGFWIFERATGTITGITESGNTFSGNSSANISSTASAAVTHPCAISTGTLADGVTGSAYSQTAGTANCGASSWSVTSGSLPSGLSLNSSTGAITGTPTTPGIYDFTLTFSTATDLMRIEVSPSGRHNIVGGQRTGDQ